MITRLRQKYPWFDHLVRAYDSYNDHLGNHFAAAITYFSVLSVIPILMVAFSVAGFVLSGTDMLEDLKRAITEEAPAGMGDTLNDVVNQAVDSRAAVGALGLLTALYAGVGWMSNLRDALTEQWGHTRPEKPFFPTLGKDLLALLGLGLALLVSFGLSALGGGAGLFLLDAVGLERTVWAKILLTVITVVVSLAANWLVFLWVISRLPRQEVHWRSAVRGALLAAIGFEVLKGLATLFLASVTSSPTGALFGPIIGLLVFANLVARFLLLVTAWTATSPENQEPVPEPPPVQITVNVRRGPSAGEAAGLLGVGGLLGLSAAVRAMRNRPRGR